MVKSVAIIGAGASGAVAAAALKSEDYFETIKVFERRHTAGGTWIYDPDPGELPLNPGQLPPETNRPLAIPEELPCFTAPSTAERFDKTPIYEDLTTNVPDIAMSFSDGSFAYGPFAPHHVPRQYIEDYFSRHGTDSFLRLGVTVEDVTKLKDDRWRLVLRRYDAPKRVDRWWTEEFDAVIIANGHYSVPYYPSRVEHSKTFRAARVYEGQRVLVIGNSASGHDVTEQLVALSTVVKPLYVSRRSTGRWDIDRPEVCWKPIITEFCQDGAIKFADDSSLDNIDKIIYCTGYNASFPFWNESSNGRPLYDYRNNRLDQNYQHTFVHDFPTLGFVGIPRVLTFRSFEYQAVALARLWSGRNARPMPSLSEQQAWEQNRVKLTTEERRKFHDIGWDSGETNEWFSWLYQFAGLPTLDGKGRCPPVLDAPTRWAVENIKKYPDTRKPPREAKKVTEPGWIVLEGQGDGSRASKDQLHYI